MFSTEIYLDTTNRAEEISLPADDKQIAQNVINLLKKIFKENFQIKAVLKEIVKSNLLALIIPLKRKRSFIQN
ncbi:MAG: hypothetical protein H0X03_03980 [Nitrosopumilus sp.]|nr:hypothetical protein [Nitrosopumilus sp.]